MIEYVLLIMLEKGVVNLGPMPMEKCAANGQRITVEIQRQRRAGEDPTYRGFIRAHCERIER